MPHFRQHRYIYSTVSPTSSSFNSFKQNYHPRTITRTKRNACHHQLIITHYNIIHTIFQCSHLHKVLDSDLGRFLGSRGGVVSNKRALSPLFIFKLLFYLRHWPHLDENYFDQEYLQYSCARVCYSVRPMYAAWTCIPQKRTNYYSTSMSAFNLCSFRLYEIIQT